MKMKKVFGSMDGRALYHTNRIYNDAEEFWFMQE